MDGLKQHVIPVKVEKRPLAAGESTHIHNLLDLNTHPLERWTVSDWGYDQRSVIFETNEAPIEEMIYVACQQQTIFAVEAFLIG